MGATKAAEVEDDDDASKAREQSVYADPIPSPAPNAIDAHLVTGLPMPTQENWFYHDDDDES